MHKGMNKDLLTFQVNSGCSIDRKTFTLGDRAMFSGGQIITSKTDILSNNFVTSPQNADMYDQKINDIKDEIQKNQRANIPLP